MKQNDYYAIKGPEISNRRLSPPSFALSNRLIDVCNAAAVFAFDLSDCKAVHFIFGFRGVGRHYRCTFDVGAAKIFIHLVRDGIPVYLQHVRVTALMGQHVEVVWRHFNISIYINGESVINIFEDSISSGQWGFQAVKELFLIPDVKLTLDSELPVKWMCLGDGFSNARWKNRDFLSWPELLLGNQKKYVNYAVSAGNSNRIKQICEQVSDTEFEGVILAMGTDDLIEKHSLDNFLEALLSITKSIGGPCRTIYICSLPPRIDEDEDAFVKVWNRAIERFCIENSYEYIDIYTVLNDCPSQLLDKIGHPNALGQFHIAKKVGEAISIPMMQELMPVGCESNTIFEFVRRVYLYARSWFDTKLDIIN